MLLHFDEPRQSIFEKSSSALLAFDLRDHSLQEAKLDQSIFANLKDFTFIKYKENQIIRFGGWKEKTNAFGPTVRITIESFQRKTDFFMSFESH